MARNVGDVRRNILSYEDFKKLPNRPKLKTAKMKLKAYNGGNVEVKGTYRNKTVKALFVISPSNVKPILGRNFSEKLELVKKIFAVDKSHCDEKDAIKDSKYSKEVLFEKYPDCFEGLGCLPQTVKIQLREDASPVIEPCRKIRSAQHN